MTRRRKVTVIAVIAALVTAAAAYAVWQVVSTGTAGGKAGALVAPTVTATTPPASGYAFPGTNGDLTFDIDNPNGYALTLIAVASAGAISSDIGGCAAYATTPGLPAGGLTVNVPVGSSSHTLTDALALDAGTPESCMGAGFTVPINAQFVAAG